MDNNQVVPQNKICLKTFFYLCIKRLFDFTSSVLMLVILLPVFLLIAIIVKAEDGGNVFYKHQRVGINGKKIGIYKFRSMKLNADKVEDMLTSEQLDEYQREFKISLNFCQTH